MKIRSSLLLACMLVVPLLAMFSHKIPPDLRQAARRYVWNPVQQSIMSGFGGAAEPVAPPVMPAVAVVAPAALHGEPEAALTVESAGTSATERKAIEDRLVALGAFSLECGSAGGADGLHRCSCRVAADPSGQLQRLFQSSDRDPLGALQHLLGQVEVWRQRIAAGQPSPALSGSVRRFQ